MPGSACIQIYAQGVSFGLIREYNRKSVLAKIFLKGLRPEPKSEAKILHGVLVLYTAGYGGWRNILVIACHLLRNSSEPPPSKPPRVLDFQLSQLNHTCLAQQ